jgi:hypothetical protein
VGEEEGKRLGGGTSRAREVRRANWPPSCVTPGGMPGIQQEITVESSTPVRGVSTEVDRRRGTPLGQYGPRIAVTATFIALTVRLLQMVGRYAVNIFFSDHWAIEDSTLFQRHSIVDIFRWQHGWHRQGLGGIAMWLFEPMTRWNMRADAYLAVVILALACAAALLLKRRLFGPITYADVTIPLLFFTPTQYENLIGPLNLAYAPFPTLLIVLFCLAWTITNDRWRCAALLVAHLLCTYTGFALLLGVMAPLLFSIEFLRTRKWVPLSCLVISVLTLVSYGLGLQPWPESEVCHLVAQKASEYPIFLLMLFSKIVQAVQPISVICFGAAIAAGIVFAFSDSVIKLVRLRTGASTRQLVITTLLGFALMFSAASAHSRSCGAAGAAARYMSYLLLGFIGLYFGALSMRKSRARTAVVGLITGIGLLSSLSIGPNLQNAIEAISRRQDQWKACYISTRNITACDERVNFIYVPNESSGSELRTKLDYLERNRLGLFR